VFHNGAILNQIFLDDLFESGTPAMNRERGGDESERTAAGNGTSFIARSGPSCMMNL
jgi:hypothetical protein